MLLAALLAGMKTKDLLNSFSLYLILETARYFARFCMKIVSKCVIRKSTMSINLVIKLSKHFLSPLITIRR